ncbi:monovalent cation:proton antiporter family protein [Bacillus sp. EB01]|uniref:monovalent cation:proton antiporter family protein n=1 Tax=Bacillus sp. EB01 TaxID=1347086 RepID=UPI0005C76809|nr:monovalent cation:proton antiporter family protein [Bacillus sp. EB01]
MQEHASFTGLMLVVSIAFLIPILLHRFRLKFMPVVVAEILVGIILGQSGFDIIQSGPWLAVLSTLGLIYLMFLSGVEIDFSAFSKKGKSSEKLPNPFLVSLIIFGLMLGLSFALAELMKWMGLVKDPFVMAIILATVSLGVVVPVLKEKKLLNTELGQTILLTAVLSDFVTMLLFVFYLASKTEGGLSPIWISILLVFVFIVYFVIKKMDNGKVYESLRRGTTQLGTRGTFALILLFVVLAEALGAEAILGAFLAGVIVSLLSPSKDFVHQLDSFGYGFLIPIFFIMIGVNLDLGAIFNDPNVWLLIPVMLLFIYIARVIPSLLLRRYYSWTETTSSGILLGATLSLAIVVATVSLDFGIISNSVASAIILVSILSCFISPMMFQKSIPTISPEKPRVSMVGANTITLPVSLDLQAEGFEVTVYSAAQNKLYDEDHNFPIVELDELNTETLFADGAFSVDVLVLGTGDEEKNLEFATFAKMKGVERIIVRAEVPEMHSKLTAEGYTVFSTTISTRVLMKSLVDNPGMIQMISQPGTLQQLIVGNNLYHGLPLRQLPFLGDALIVKIYRGDIPIIPHGDTELLTGDRLIVSGSSGSIQRLRDELG